MHDYTDRELRVWEEHDKQELRECVERQQAKIKDLEKELLSAYDCKLGNGFLNKIQELRNAEIEEQAIFDKIVRLRKEIASYHEGDLSTECALKYITDGYNTALDELIVNVSKVVVDPALRDCAATVVNIVSSIADRMRRTDNAKV